MNNTVQTTNGQQCHSIGKPGQGNLQGGIVRNLHCINDNSPAIVNNSPPAPLTTSNNVDPGQTNVNATTQGYTMANGYSPTTTSGNVTVGQGMNLTSLCTGVMVSLCSDTSFGVSYNVATHVVTGVGRVATARPSSGAWDIGAYQQTGSAPPPLLPPTLLSAVIQ